MIGWIETHRWLAAGCFLVAAALVAVLGVALAGDSGGPTGAAPAPATTTTAATTTTTFPTTFPTTTTTTPVTTGSRGPATGPPSTTTARTTPTATAPFPAGLRGLDIEVLPTSSKIVALTFDAGANSAGLSGILDTLAAQHVPATFFLTGNWARDNPSGVARIVAGGHRVGNHTMSHPNLTELSDAAIATQLAGAQQAIRSAGADPRPLFRFPFGDRDTRTIAAVNRLGYLPIRWTVDTLGWQGTSGGVTARQVLDRVVGALTPGEIVLMHVGANPDDGSTLDADALPGVISTLRAHGYRFVTLDVLLQRT